MFKGLLENFINTYKTNYLNFEGRARRREFWQFMLGWILAIIAIFVVIAVLIRISETLSNIMGVLLVIFMLGSIIPMIALSVRRMHDINKSGWFVLIQLIPTIGGIIFLVFALQDGTEAANQYGPDPKAAERGQSVDSYDY